MTNKKGSYISFSDSDIEITILFSNMLNFDTIDADYICELEKVIHDVIVNYVSDDDSEEVVVTLLENAILDSFLPGTELGVKVFLEEKNDNFH